MKTPKLTKSFCAEAFEDQTGEWLSDGHWLIKRSAYQLPKGFEADPRRCPSVDSVLPNGTEACKAVEWSNIETSTGGRFGRIIESEEKATLCMANREYLDRLNHHDELFWWATGNLSPLFLTVGNTFSPAAVVAVLMPMRCDADELKLLMAADVG